MRLHPRGRPQMTSHVRRRREVVQQLPSATARVLRWIRRRRSPVQVRLRPRSVGWTWRPGSVVHRPTCSHPPEHPVDAHSGDASGLSRDASTQVAASATMPSHVDGGGHPSDPDSWGPAHAVPRVPSALATMAPRRCAHGARVCDEARARREGTRMRRLSCVERAVSVSSPGPPE